MEHATSGGGNQRTQGTRAWIVTAFNRVVLGRGYASLSVGELSRRAGVGRTTFYEHFRDKDDVLRHALTPVLLPLADAAVGSGDACRVRQVLEHLVENRARVMEMLESEARSHVEKALADLIAARLCGVGSLVDEATRSLESAGKAGAILAVIRAWLREKRAVCSSEQVAEMLVRKPVR